MKHYLGIYTLFLSLLGLGFASTALANDINLYDQPQASAKVLGKVDLTTGVIPIFTNKAGDWMKVGDPRNGNVGWIKSSDMNSPGTPTSFSYTQKMMNDTNGVPHTYQLIQFGKPQNLPPDQAQAILKKVQQQQQLIHQTTQKAIQDIVNQMNTLYQSNGMANFPLIMPIVFMPTPNAPVNPPAPQQHK